MRKTLQRIKAGVVSVAVACSMMLGGLGLQFVQAEGESGGDRIEYAAITVSFQNDGDASEGEVQITTGAGIWAICEAGQAVSASAVRIVPNSGKRIDWTATRLAVSGSEIEVKDKTEIQDQLKSEHGYSLTAGTEYRLTGVEFADGDASGDDPGEQDPGEQDPGNQGSWENAYDRYLTPGVNILSTWIGSSVGDITYEFSDSASDWTGSTKQTLSRAAVEGWLNTLQSGTASDEEKNTAKSNLFGIKPSSGQRYLRLTTGEDLGGNHLGFEVYQISQSGSLERQDGVEISYYDYRTKQFVTMTDQNREWEDYLKCSSYYVEGADQDQRSEGLIIDLKNIKINDTVLDLMSDSNTYALRCLLPFDSRKNISWWNAKYKEQVAAAGDQVSDDSWVENGMVDLVKVVSGDKQDVYYSNEPGWTAQPGIDESLIVKIGRAGYDFSDDEHLRPGYDGAHGSFTAEEMKEAAEKASGQCNVPVNSYVTVKLTPDPGYQILCASLNGMPLTPDEDTPSQFTFQITSNIHFQAVFEETSDVVDVTGAQAVSAAQIKGTTDVVDNGNVALTVTDDADYNDAKALNVVNGTKVAALDVVVDQILAKAGKLSEEEQKQAREGTLAVTEDKYWKQNMTELENPVNISLDLDHVTLEANETLAVVRDHKGECTEIPVTVETQNNVLSVGFASDKFSTYTIIKKASSTGGNSGGSTGDSSGGSQSGGSSSSSSGSSTPAADTTTDNTKTETKPDGTKVETTTGTKSDGTKVNTTVETKTDGTRTETVVETAKDGSVKTTETVTKADGSATKTEKETETNTKGKEVAITTTTEKDTNGKVTGITQTSEIAQIAGSTSATVTVEKTADGKITSAEAEVDKKGANSKQGVGATLFGSVVSQITEAAGTKSVDISMTVTAGKKEYIVKADAQDLEAGNKLKVMAIDEKTGNYVLVNAKTYTVNKSGSVKVVLPEGMTYQLMDTKKAAAVEKKILSTVKAKKTAVTVEKGKKTSIQLNSRLDMDNVEKISYSTSKKSVATVNKNGTVTAKQSGKVTIQAKVLLKNGKTKTVKMTVTVKP